MKTRSVTFRLRTLYYDSPHESDDGEVLTTPWLEVYYSAEDAAADNEGLSIVETLDGYGDLWFFAADGSPLRAEFSKPPHFNDNNTYFPGAYSLKRGAGDDLLRSLAKLIAKNRSPHSQIIVDIAATDETANRFGWADAQTMAHGVTHALQILPPDMLKRVVFARYPNLDELYPNIPDALAGKTPEAT